jgi:hypothetical protein
MNILAIIAISIIVILCISALLKDNFDDWSS